MRTWNSVLLIGLAAAVGCHHAPVAQAPAPAAPLEDLAARARADSIEAARRARADSVALAQRADADRRARDAADRLARTQAALLDTLTQRTHFGFDRADLRSEDREALNRKVPILLANPGVMLRIAGHADERGSDEYNFALGNRRAAAAKTYLVNLGVAPDRLDVVSFGEEHPLIVGQDESAWAMNRRDEFIAAQGADALVAPQAGR